MGLLGDMCSFGASEKYSSVFFFKKQNFLTIPAELGIAVARRNSMENDQSQVAAYGF